MYTEQDYIDALMNPDMDLIEKISDIKTGKEKIELSFRQMQEDRSFICYGYPEGKRTIYIKPVTRCFSGREVEMSLLTPVRTAKFDMLDFFAKEECNPKDCFALFYAGITNCGGKIRVELRAYCSPNAGIIKTRTFPVFSVDIGYMENAGLHECPIEKSSRMQKEQVTIANIEEHTTVVMNKKMQEAGIFFGTKLASDESTTPTNPSWFSRLIASLRP